MLNKVLLMGRLTRDPELKHTATGTAVTACTLACDRDFKDKQTGEKTADFINVVAWRATAEFLTKYFAKGRMIVVEGRLQARNYVDKDGNKRTAVDVVADNVYFGDSKPQDGGRPLGTTVGGEAQSGTAGFAPAGKAVDVELYEVEDDEALPF